MADLFQRIPPELLEPIIEEVTIGDEDQHVGATNRLLNRTDVLNLSATCRSLRRLLVPWIYRTVVLHNTHDSAAYVQSLAQGDNQRYIKQLHFKGVATFPRESMWRTEEPDPRATDVQNVLPSVVSSILENLGQFQCLEDVIVEFFPDEEDDCIYQFFWDRFDDEQTEDIEQAESTLAWRALLRQTFVAIARNRPSALKKLEYRNAVCQDTSAFHTPEYALLLSNLGEFRFRMRELPNDYNLCTTDAFYHFVSGLNGIFFDHLSSVTSCTIDAAEGGGFFSNCFGLPPQAMPHLRFLSLRWVEIDGGLSRFLDAHANTLEILKLRDCFTNGDTLNFRDSHPNRAAFTAMYWHEFWTALAQAKPTRLKQLRFTPCGIDLNPDEYKWHVSKITMSAVQLQTLRDNMSEARPLFQYVYKDDKYGFIQLRLQETLDYFEKGQDQAAFERLRAIMRENGGNVE